jgi:hypothetical protein
MGERTRIYSYLTLCPTVRILKLVSYALTDWSVHNLRAHALNFMTGCLARQVSCSESVAILLRTVSLHALCMLRA